MLSVWDVSGNGNWSCIHIYLYMCIAAVSNCTKKPHQKFCLWFTCTEFPAAVDEWGRVWWVSSDHDLQHTLGQFAIECEAAGMKVHTWCALPESGRKKSLFWFESELLPQVNELGFWACASPRGASDLTDYGDLSCSAGIRTSQLLLWTPTKTQVDRFLKMGPLFRVWKRDYVSLPVVFLM